MSKMHFWFQVLAFGLACYGALMGWINFKLHKALKDCLQEEGIMPKDEDL